MNLRSTFFLIAGSIKDSSMERVGRRGRLPVLAGWGLFSCTPGRLAYRLPPGEAHRDLVPPVNYCFAQPPAEIDDPPSPVGEIHQALAEDGSFDAPLLDLVRPGASLEVGHLRGQTSAGVDPFVDGAAPSGRAGSCASSQRLGLAAHIFQQLRQAWGRGLRLGQRPGGGDLFFHRCTPRRPPCRQDVVGGLPLSCTAWSARVVPRPQGQVEESG